MQNYKVDILTLTGDGYVRSDCADITFLNAGQSNVTINNAVLLTPGQSFGLTANSNEIDRTIYTFTFSGIGSTTLIVARKTYV